MGEKDRILRPLDKEIGDDPIRDEDTRGCETKDARLVSQLPSFEMRASFVKERFECLSSKELLIFLQRDAPLRAKAGHHILMLKLLIGEMLLFVRPAPRE